MNESQIVRRCRIVFVPVACLFLAVAIPSRAGAADPPRRPNIVWITSEDHGPHLGCYGDSYTTTPHVDALAARGLRYARVWSNAPVCAPARTTLISGLYATSTGAEHMRSMVPFPAGKKMFPQYLRETGYYCTNNNKEDYNIAQPGKVRDDSSRMAHWRHRAAGQPFFAVFNSTKSHESQIRARPHELIHNPAGVRVPPYHPDTPEVRRDWAQYYDGVTAADADAGERLRELEEAGLLESTIVFYFADHGSGMPRSKRCPPCDSGLHVPLVVYLPDAFRELRPADYQAGGSSDRLASFVDFAPTVLSLAGIKPPEWMQGFAFLGKYAAAPQQYLFGFRGRMDERMDLARSVTDGRYVYVRNYMPHKIPGQHLAYMFQTPTTRVWHRLHTEKKKLTPAQDAFWNSMPAEELYDLATDPDEIKNLANVEEFGEVRRRLMLAQQELAHRVRDVGFLPEGEMHARSVGITPYDMGHDDQKYPFEQVFRSAQVASRGSPNFVADCEVALQDPDSAVRYWGVMGLLMRDEGHGPEGLQVLRGALADTSPDVRIAAAEALARFGDNEDKPRAIEILVPLANCRENNVFVAMAALNALYAIDELPHSVRQTLKELPRKGTVPDNRYESYVGRLIDDFSASP